MAELTVFRTSNPVALASFESAVEEYKAWSDRIREFARSAHPDAHPMVGTAWGQDRFDGISMVDPIPDGWRVQKQKLGSTYLVPKRSVKAGKEAATRMDELHRAPDVRASLPGMPNVVWMGMGTTSPGVHPDLEQGALYVTWSGDPTGDKANAGFSKTAETVDLNLWERVKLSDYYALKEAKESVDA